MNMILKTRNLCKEFNQQKAVQNVSLNIRENCIYGLLGPLKTLERLLQCHHYMKI